MRRILLLVAAALAAGCSSTAPAAPSPAATPSPTAVLAHVTGVYPAHCTLVTTSAGPLPDRQCTPGNVATTDRTAVCTPGWAAAHRPRAAETNRVKAAARRAYGVRGPAELDHLIPLSLGGSNDVSNLWPEPGPVPNPKDRVEASLRAAVCRHGLDLVTAQRAIALQWTTAAEAVR